MTRVALALLAFMTVVAGVAVAAALWFARDARQAKPKIEAAVQGETVAKLETVGARETTQRVAIALTVKSAAEAVAADAAHESQSAEDADEPLDLARADRLRAADERLCKLAPAACAVAAGRNASRGEGPVLAADPAAPAQP